MEDPREPFRALRDADGSDRWRAELLRAGLLKERGARPEEGPERVRWEARVGIVKAFRELVEREAKVTELSHPIGLATGAVPWQVWVTGGAVIVGFVGWLPFIYAFPASLLSLGAMAGIGLALTAVAELRRRDALALEKAALAACVGRLREAVGIALRG
jgi:hypothetical protein